MKNNKRAVFYTVFFTALFFYFYTESLLRQAAASNVSESEDVSLKQIIDYFPASIREDVKYRVNKAAIQDRINEAKTVEEKVAAYVSMAVFTKDKREREKIYAMLIKQYPECRNSLNAFTYFLLKNGSKNRVSIERFHTFINKCDSLHKLGAWRVGLNKINKLKVKNEVKLQYLQPLLSYKPEFKDYYRFYDIIVKLAVKKKNESLEQKARNLKKACLGMPTLATVIRKQELKKMRQLGKKKKK